MQNSLRAVMVAPVMSISTANARTLQGPLIGQETDQWCWADSGQMIMNHLEARATEARAFQDFSSAAPPTLTPSLGFQGPEEARTGTLGDVLSRLVPQTRETSLVMP